MQVKRFSYVCIIMLFALRDFCSCDQSGDSGELLCTSGKEGSSLFCPLLVWAPADPRSSSLMPLTVNDSIKGLTKYRQAPLHHSLLCWNELWSCLFKAKEPRGQWWDTTASLSPRKKCFTTNLIFLSFLVLLRFLTQKAAINHCQCCLHLL